MKLWGFVLALAACGEAKQSVDLADPPPRPVDARPLVLATPPAEPTFGSEAKLSVMAVGQSDCKVMYVGTGQPIELGTSPIVAKSIPAGLLTVMVRCADGRKYDQRVLARPGGAEKIIIKPDMFTR